MSEKTWTNIFYTLAVAFLGLFAYLLFESREGQLLSILAALVALLGSRMKDVLKFKFSATGIEAEMQSLLDEAKATVTQLHLLAVNQAKILLESVQAAGRWGGGSSRQDKERMRTTVVETLTRLGVERSQIEEVLAVERRYVHFDYAHAVTHDLKPTQDKIADWNDFFSDRKRKGIGSEPKPDELEAFLDSIGLLDWELKERLDDYRHYDQTGSHRRPDNILMRRS